MKQTSYCLVLAGGVLFSTACKDSQACESARLELGRMWKEAKATASKNQVIRPDVIGEMNDAEKNQHIETWTDLTAKAELLESSYQTTQVTWDSAEQAEKELQTELATYKGHQPKIAFQGFEMLVKEAAEKSKKFEQQCR